MKNKQTERSKKIRNTIFLRELISILYKTAERNIDNKKFEIVLPKEIFERLYDIEIDALNTNEKHSILGFPLKYY